MEEVKCSIFVWLLTRIDPLKTNLQILKSKSDGHSSLDDGEFGSL
jgi:hypothetical protein